MSDVCYLGIDTSNYTTSLAFCNADGQIIANLKRPLAVDVGERGLRQSDAVFQHTKNLPLLFASARELFEAYKPIAIGVSATPRKQKDSYMPCFLAGVSVAQALSATLGVTLYSFSHQNGHIMAAAYSAGVADRLIGHEFLAFHVSGGTTEVLHVIPDESDFRCEIVGGTKDINAGQAIDRSGVAMGLAFPCGPALERMALSFEGRIEKKKICVDRAFCNLSGVENMALSMIEKGEPKEKVAAFVLDFVGRTLKAMTEAVRDEFPGLPVLYAGGVMSCGILKEMLKAPGSYFSESAFSADNAAGVALLTRRAALSCEDVL